MRDSKMKYILIAVLVIGSTGCSHKHWDDQTTWERTRVTSMIVIAPVIGALYFSSAFLENPHYYDLQEVCSKSEYTNKNNKECIKYTNLVNSLSESELKSYAIESYLGSSLIKRTDKGLLFEYREPNKPIEVYIR